MVFMSVMPTLAEDEISVLVDGNRLVFDTNPQIVNNRTMVPVAKIFEAMGAEVSWDQNTRTVTAVKDETVVNFVIDKKEFTVSGVKKELDSPAIIINGRTMVPVRAVSESFNCTCSWNGETRQVIITSKKEEPKTEEKDDSTYIDRLPQDVKNDIEELENTKAISIKSADSSYDRIKTAIWRISVLSADEKTFYYSVKGDNKADVTFTYNYETDKSVVLMKNGSETAELEIIPSSKNAVFGVSFEKDGVNAKIKANIVRSKLRGGQFKDYVTEESYINSSTGEISELSDDGKNDFYNAAYDILVDVLKGFAKIIAKSKSTVYMEKLGFSEFHYEETYAKQVAKEATNEDKQKYYQESDYNIPTYTYITDRELLMKNEKMYYYSYVRKEYVSYIEAIKKLGFTVSDFISYGDSLTVIYTNKNTDSKGNSYDRLAVTYILGQNQVMVMMGRAVSDYEAKFDKIKTE